MAKKLSELTAATAAAGVDLMVLVQGGVTKRVSAALLPISNAVQAALTALSTRVANLEANGTGGPYPVVGMGLPTLDLPTPTTGDTSFSERVGGTLQSVIVQTKSAGVLTAHLEIAPFSATPTWTNISASAPITLSLNETSAGDLIKIIDISTWATTIPANSMIRAVVDGGGSGLKYARISLGF